MKKIIAFILVIMMAFTSCSSDRGEVVFAYGEAEFDENLYLYELAVMKTQLLQDYGVSTDIPQLWAEPIGEGVTYDDYAYAQCQMNIATVLFFADYALKNGGELTKEDNKKIDDAINDIVEQYGSKAAVNKYLETFTIDLNMYREYLELYALYNKGVGLAYAQGGKYEISLERMKEYYEQNFVTVKHIAIGTEFAGSDEEGNLIYYTEEEKEAKRDLIDSIKQRLENGEDFDSLYTLSEDKSFETYPDGYTITKGVLDTAMKGYENVALSLMEGEWDIFELEGTSVYIIKRVPLIDSDFNNCANSIYTALLQLDMAERVIENYDSLTINQEIVDNYNMSVVPILS